MEQPDTDLDHGASTGSVASRTCPPTWRVTSDGPVLGSARVIGHESGGRLLWALAALGAVVQAEVTT